MRQGKEKVLLGGCVTAGKSAVVVVILVCPRPSSQLLRCICWLVGFKTSILLMIE